MAKTSMRERTARNERLVKKYLEPRLALKKIIKSSTDPDEIRVAQDKLPKLPINSNPVRLTTRCQQCGRSHAVYRKFGLCRICLRQQLMTGNVAGGRKSSW